MGNTSLFSISIWTLTYHICWKNSGKCYVLEAYCSRCRVSLSWRRQRINLHCWTSKWFLFLKDNLYKAQEYIQCMYNKNKEWDHQHTEFKCSMLTLWTTRPCSSTSWMWRGKEKRKSHRNFSCIYNPTGCKYSLREANHLALWIGLPIAAENVITM